MLQDDLVLNVMYPCAKRIVPVMDNLNTHALDSLYKQFRSDDAYRLARRLEIHHTLKHDSWLNMAEIGLNVLVRQCLNRRIESHAKLQREVRTWESLVSCTEFFVKYCMEEF